MSVFFLFFVKDFDLVVYYNVGGSFCVVLMCDYVGFEVFELVDFGVVEDDF